jgi:NADH:ubiquinone oxidoreductase subunit 5 (subunit L)/multisubunit Na+/H+ antiporter MnhA subunit
MGYLFSGCGFLCYNEVIFYLSIHALNKAFLFILVGYIVHFFNSNTDLRFMGSLYFYSYDIVFILFIVSLNLTGLPYTSGFLSKEFLLFQTLKDQFLVYIIRSCWFVSFFFTPVYMLLINIYVFFYSKNSPNSLFLNLHISQYSKFFKSSYYETFDYSQVYSKLTGFVLLLLFIIVNVTGESYLLILLEFFSLSDTMVNHSVNHFTISSISTNALNSSMLTWYILYGVLLSLYSGLRYLKNIIL